MIFYHATAMLSAVYAIIVCLCVCLSHVYGRFLPCDAMLSVVHAVVVCLSVCLSVRLSANNATR